MLCCIFESYQQEIYIYLCENVPDENNSHGILALEKSGCLFSSSLQCFFTSAGCVFVPDQSEQEALYFYWMIAPIVLGTTSRASC